MMYYQYKVPNPFYELKYNATLYKQYFYDVLMATMFLFTIYSYTNFPASTIFLCHFISGSKMFSDVRRLSTILAQPMG